MRSLGVHELIRTGRDTTIALSDKKGLLFLRIRLLIDPPYEMRDDRLYTRGCLEAANVMRGESQPLK